MTKQLLLEVRFKDGSSITLRPTAGEAERATKDFKEGKERIEVGTLEGGVEKAVFSVSEIRAIVPQWISED